MYSIINLAFFSTCILSVIEQIMESYHSKEMKPKHGRLSNTESFEADRT